ncbi:hypothetical protein IKF04_04095 [Candidatus Saccharibacteria bacterium]|nr:hypothetical protein [Candidatus Saccharibacteria bacterium]
MSSAPGKKRNSNYNHRNSDPEKIKQVFNSAGELDWEKLGEMASEVATEEQKQEIGRIAMTANRAAVATVEDFLDARKELARLGVHYEKQKEKTGLLREGAVYKVVTEKYGNALNKQRIYNEQLNSLRGTVDNPRWIPGDGMVTISNLIPRIEGQTGQEYAEYITKIHKQIPKEENETDAVYGRRILDAYNDGDLQFLAARALIDPQSEVDIAIEQRLSRITEIEKRLKENPSTSQEAYDRAKRQLKEAKLKLYEIATDAERNGFTSEDQGYKAREKSLWSRITSPLFKKDERRNRNKLRASEKEGMAVVSKLIPKIEGQTARDYQNLIEKIYSRYPKAINETNTEYEQEIDGDDLYTFAARIIIGSQSSYDGSGSFIDIVEDEIRAKFKQIEDALKKPDGTKATELASQMRQAKMDVFKKLVEERIKTLAGH